MILSSRSEPISGAIHAQVSLGTGDDALTEVERQAIAAVGEPIVEVGGDFSGNSLTITLPTNQLRFPSQFPAKQVFVMVGDVNAAGHANLWVTTVQERIVEGMKAARTANTAAKIKNEESFDTTP